MKRLRAKFNLLAGNASGFTLIELLIVIVIIGILAGVLIAVIDPASQQNRARDANVQATINKIALAVGGFRSAYGRPPDALEFRSLVTGVLPHTLPAGTNCTAGTNLCVFNLASIPLINNVCTAASNNVWGVNTTAVPGGQCQFSYERQTGAAANEFEIRAKSFGINNGVFKYDSRTSAINQCTDTNPDC